MAKRPETSSFGGPVGWPQLSLYLTVRDPAASIGFYGKAFGFDSTGETMKDDAGNIQHAGMRLGDVAIMFAPAPPDGSMQSPVASGAPDSHTFYIYVPDVDALAQQARSAGAKMLQPPANQFWGDRIAIFKCPDGYHWTFATHIADFDPGNMPAG